MLSPELVEILACPSCKGRLVQNEAARRLDCRACGLGFPVREHEGRPLPVMLVEEAEKIGTEQGDAVRKHDMEANMTAQ